MEITWIFLIVCAALFVGFICGTLMMYLIFLSKKLNSLIPDTYSSKTLSEIKRVE